MNSPDDKNTLARRVLTPRPRQAVSAKNFSLPKPYRRQLFAEYPPRLSSMQIGLLTCVAIVGAALVAVLAVLVDESADSPNGKVIVVAANAEIVPAAEVQRASFQAATSEEEAVAAAAKEPLAAAAALAVPPSALPLALLPSLADALPGHIPPRTMLAAMRRDKPTPVARLPVLTAALPQPDPDVVLITAILLLTPPPLPVELAEPVPGICSQAMLKDNTCIELQGVR